MGVAQCASVHVCVLCLKRCKVFHKINLPQVLFHLLNIKNYAQPCTINRFSSNKIIYIQQE